jgi:microcystin-dependent protein
MSTFKGNAYRHLSSTVDNIALDSSGNTTVRNLTATSINSGSVTVTNDLTVQGNTTIGNSSSDNLTVNATVSGSSFNAGIIGEVRMYSGSGASAPSGWLYCNGSTIGPVGSGATYESNDYQTLFELLQANSNWGNTGSESWVSGTDTVKLPDFRGVFPVGVGQNQDSVKYTSATNNLNQPGTNFSLSDKGGREEHVLADGEVNKHTHSVTTGGESANFTVNNASTGVTTQNNTHNHTITDPGHVHQLQEEIGRDWTSKSENYDLGIENWDSNDPITMNSLSATTGISLAANTHNHGINDPQHTHTISQTDHTHSVAIAPAVGEYNTPHTNLPPYLAINFIIKY